MSGLPVLLVLLVLLALLAIRGLRAYRALLVLLEQPGLMVLKALLALLDPAATRVQPDRPATNTRRLQLILLRYLLGQSRSPSRRDWP